MALALACSWPVYAQEARDGLNVTGEVRLRYEAIDGQARAGFNKSDDLLNARTAVLAEYRAGRLRAGMELYDSRVWGEGIGTPVSTNEVNALEPVQAYVGADVPNAFGDGSSLAVKIGRMTLNLGSRRLVSADGYRNTTNGYTGIRGDFAGRGHWNATLLFVLPQTRLPNDTEGVRDARVQLDRESFDLVFWGGQVSKSRAVRDATLELTYFHLGERDSPSLQTRDRTLETLGGRVIVDPRISGFDFELEALYQSGHISSSTAPSASRLSVGAGFVHADAGYSFSRSWRPRLSLEFDLATGNQSGGHYGRFDTLFGSRRGDLAPGGLYNAVGRTNVIAPGVRLQATPSGRLTWFIAYRALWLAANEDSFSTSGVRDPSGQSGNFAGHQLDGRVRYWIVPARLQFEFDGLLLSKGRFLRDAPNAPPGRVTSYGSANLTFSF